MKHEVTAMNVQGFVTSIAKEVQSRLFSPQFKKEVIQDAEKLMKEQILRLVQEGNQ